MRFTIVSAAVLSLGPDENTGLLVYSGKELLNMISFAKKKILSAGAANVIVRSPELTTLYLAEYGPIEGYDTLTIEGLLKRHRPVQKKSPTPDVKTIVRRLEQFYKKVPAPVDTPVSAAPETAPVDAHMTPVDTPASAPVDVTADKNTVKSTDVELAAAQKQGRVANTPMSLPPLSAVIQRLDKRKSPEPQPVAKRAASEDLSFQYLLNNNAAMEFLRKNPPALPASRLAKPPTAQEIHRDIVQSMKSAHDDVPPSWRKKAVASDSSTGAVTVEYTAPDGTKITRVFTK